MNQEIVSRVKDLTRYYFRERILQPWNFNDEPLILHGDHADYLIWFIYFFNTLLFKLLVRACSIVYDSLQPYELFYSPGSSANGILHARILEWVVIFSSRGSSRPRDPTHVSCVSCIGRLVL